MTHCLPRFVSAVLLLPLLGAIAALGQDFTPINLDSRASNRAPAAGAGQKLVAEAAQRVFEEPAIAADLRYQVDAFGQELIGTGRYLQLGQGANKLLRLDLKMQVAGKPATLQEVCDPLYYWVRRDVPPAPATLGRVDLQTFRKTLAARLNEPQQILPSDGWIVLGGLPRLLASLEKNFVFGKAEAQNLEFTGDDGLVQRLPIWVIEGRWKPEQLAQISGREAGRNQTGELPDQLPDVVRLTLGRTTSVLPLFPYRVAYLKQAKSSGEDAKPAPLRELLTLELFNVHRKGDIDEREFQYSPADQQVQDLTRAYLQRFDQHERR
jgi:hypothetical protein